MRTRYAPSPTGLQHIGGIRTALFCYLLAKSQNGQFILRIEDTDRKRYFEQAEQDIEDSFNFLGIKYDEKYIQSQRMDLYKQMSQKLLDTGHAYKCFCSSERLDELRKEQEKSKSSTLGYDRHCLNLSKEELENNKDKPFVIRFKVPTFGSIEFEDGVLGKQVFECKNISPDPILIKTDGYPTYHLANVVDDHMMNISHVYRAQEWLSSTPLHILIYKAFGLNPPLYAHLPIVVGEDGKKLSKRHGSTSLKEFVKNGYLKESIINHIALLGFSVDDKTTYLSLDELEKCFDAKKISKSPAVFDYKKLNHFNSYYIRQKTDNELLDLISPFLDDDIPKNDKNINTLLKAMLMIKERMILLSEINNLAKFLFIEPVLNTDDFAIKKQKTDVKYILNLILNDFDNIFCNKNAQDIEKNLKQIYIQNDIKPRDFFMPLRIAITGSQASLPLAESIILIGFQNTKQRIKNALSLLG